MKSIASLLPVAVLVTILVLPMLAQQQSGPGGPPPPPPPPGLLADAVFGEVVAGDFNRDLGRDVVVLDAGVPTLCLTPGVFRTALRWDGGLANDLLAIPSDGASADRLLVVGPGGLDELLFNDVTRRWDTLPRGGPEWLGATALACGEFDGLPGVDLVGLASNGRDLLFAHAAGDGFVAAPGFPTYAAAYDVLAIDWDGDGIDEVVARTDYGVELFSAAGAEVDHYPWSLSELVLAVLDDPAHVGQRLAIIIRVAPGGTQWIFVKDIDGNELVTGLGSRDVFCAASGDLDDDGDSDLVLGIRGSPAYTVLTARSDLEQANPDAKTFVPGEIVDVPFGPQGRDPSANAAGLVIADFDADGDADVVAPAQGNYTSGPAGSAAYSEVCLVPGSSAGDDALRLDIASARIVWEIGVPLRDFEITVLGPAQALTPTEGQTLHLEAILFHTPDLWEPTDDAPTEVQYLPLPAPGVEQIVSFQILNLGGWQDPNLYSYILRQVLKQGDVVVAEGPPTTAVYAPDIHMAWLGQLSPAPTTIITPNNLEGGSTPPGGGMNVGGSLPDSDEDEAPRSR